MDIEEMMIDYILNRAMPGEVEEFFRVCRLWVLYERNMRRKYFTDAR